jgi:hypothetical protein
MVNLLLKIIKMIINIFLKRSQKPFMKDYKTQPSPQNPFPPNITHPKNAI